MTERTNEAGWTAGVGNGKSALSARVEKIIGEQQDSSERLIGWFQLCIISIFATLYFISPKPLAAQSAFAPVPWVLTAYFGFTLLRLGLSWRRRLADWFLYLSVIADMALLLGLIWSFHIQYGQPPSFYLKTPTLLYVFIFIALRALRFEARFVIAAGLTAAAGWLVLSGYAVATTGLEMVTRDYVYYMTHNSVLIGAEFDKIVSILLVTAVLAVAITRARSLLVRSVAESMAAEDLSRFFSPDIAHRIRQSEAPLQPGQGEYREGAVLNLDIRGFTGLSRETPPDELMSLLADYHKRMVPLIRAHGGTVDKFLGDGIMATFGVDALSETYAADALAAIDEIMAAVDSWAGERRAQSLVPIEVNAAVANGRFVFGAIGDGKRLEYTVIGDTVNLSAKLEKQNKAEGVRGLATLTCFETATVQGYRPPREREIRGGVRVNGIEGPVDLVVIAP